MRLDGQLVHKTQTLARTVAPIWEASKEVLVFSKPDAVVGITVLDEKSGADPQLGVVNVKLADILEANAKQQDWFPLSGCDTGRVRLTAQWKGLQMTGAINGAGVYTPPIGVLRLFIRRGVDLKNVEGMTGGKSDPYVRIHQSGIVLARTLVINNKCVVGACSYCSCR
jgi:Ca2+-dependent lipid-binding protein